MSIFGRYNNNIATESLDTEINQEDTFDSKESIDDYDTDDNIFDELANETTGIETLISEVSQLADAGAAVEEFGVAPGTIKIMQITGLLTGTSLEAIAVESVVPSSGSDTESQLAIEALTEKVKEKTAALAAKVVSVTKTGADKIMKVLKVSWEAVSNLGKKLAEKSWDATKATGRTIKAHPYATVAAVVTAMVAVGGVLAYAGKMPVFGSNATVVGSWQDNLILSIRKIKWPFGSVNASKNEAGKIVLEMVQNKEGVWEAADMSKLGWTKNAITVIMKQLSKVWSSISSGFSAFAARVTKITAKDVLYKAGLTAARFLDGANNVYNAGYRGVAKTVGGAFGNSFAGQVGTHVMANAAGGSAMMAYFTGFFALVFSVVRIVYELIKFIVVSGYQMIASTFRAVSNAVGHESAVATA